MTPCHLPFAVSHEKLGAKSLYTVPRRVASFSCSCFRSLNSHLCFTDQLSPGVRLDEAEAQREYYEIDDMVMTAEQKIYWDALSSARVRRAALKNAWLWPGAVIPYSFERTASMI